MTAMMFRNVTYSYTPLHSGYLESVSWAEFFRCWVVHHQYRPSIPTNWWRRESEIAHRR